MELSSGLMRLAAIPPLTTFYCRPAYHPPAGAWPLPTTMDIYIQWSGNPPCGRNLSQIVGKEASSWSSPTHSHPNSNSCPSPWRWT
ncbi:hypothetical protein TNIN_215711 [Trichonephila inaurata madagascariensis]|uniref:Uncharacterized protein n=1 Tax=Trichonephila inaurata madagascariensis TaxID=2747483 RepID=A0A8X6JCN2_9ARAC|nr:hypothetical protein TNIN_215711 [Trichonephila inaurata madagascariensis]